MQFISRRASELLDKLLIVAGGDLNLVMDAIHEAAVGRDSAPLDAVLNVILARRRLPPRLASKTPPAAPKMLTRFQGIGRLDA